MNSSEQEECSGLEMMQKDLHATFLELMYYLLPSPYESQETNHLTLAYFVISGLDILNSLHSVAKDAVVSWVLSFQAHPGAKADLNDGQFYGFHGSKTSQFPPDKNGVLIHNNSHLASTYCAIAILKIVGYELSNLDSESIASSMRNLQQPDGSFIPIHIGGETDLRFVYCAAAICFMLNNWSGMDKEKAKDYILRCQSYDGGFGLVPGAESHGGGTYCAIASLRLMGLIEDNILSDCASSTLIDVPLLLEWILQRQGNDGGFQGRPNKSSDTCYAFWIGAVLRILGGSNFVDHKALRGFLLSCQYKYGGFSKFPGEYPDLYHSFYGFTAFSLLEESGLKSLCSQLGITENAAMGL
ncbi:geranylgeranyl transferase type-1 subunit beta isoform X1 [Vigna unguiculata]|uniref:Geranylgeranyl transferase type-1 subunit beta n=1 Tax=Vigna unguiculata TaxID=3917 RepID=A0A4D6NGK4_VIGUN|nr:geranylgeranyl transferase type-1 subunit beta isoform X1 [Vigna unguiculata]QCE12880.1 geranylgeranyl transferase type-1 subunit beta [Vigna unguiculata]